MDKRFQSGRQRVGLASLVLIVVVLIASCTTDDSTAGHPSTSGTPTPTQVTTPNRCQSEDRVSQFENDLDHDGLDELVSMQRQDGSSSLVVCIGNDYLELEIPGENADLVGFQDLDDDGTSEILFTRDGTRGRELGAAAINLRGLYITPLALEHWISDGGEVGAFEAESFQCVDWDGDGIDELIHWQFGPADGEVTVSAAIVKLDGDAVVEAGVDRYETDEEDARSHWDSPDGCGPGETVVRDVRFSAAGWAKVNLHPELYADRDDVALTSIARSGNRLVAVGTEAPNVAVDHLAEARPLAWWSTDGLSWNEATVEGQDAELLDVISYDGGFLAVGRAGASPAVWTSNSGTSWQMTRLGTTLADGQGVIFSVTTSDLGLVAVGQETYWQEGSGDEDSDAAAWISEDGRNWLRIESPSFGAQGYQPNEGIEFNGAIYDVAYHPNSGFVAVGYDSDIDSGIDFPEQYPAVWTSLDATQWKRQRIEHDARLTGIINTAELLVVYGSTDRHGSPTSDGVILVSADARNWTAASGDFGPLGEENGIQSINAIRKAPDDTWLALGSDQIELDSRGAVAVWQSTDLKDWVRQPHDPSSFGIVDETPSPFITDATTTGQGILIAVGSSGNTIELTGGGSVCCLYRPHILAFDPRRETPSG